MRYPIRHATHVTETASFKRLDQCIPAHWIMRHVSERDYGIDCLIEPVIKAGGPMTGDLLAIQLKGTAEVAWSDTTEDAEATFSGTEVETVNYWMGLPVPVFLCIHDQKSDSVFFAPVKQQVRRRYDELLKQKTFGFTLHRKLALDVKHLGEAVLFAFYLRERAHVHFAGALTDLLVNRDVYAEYIESKLDRDCFMEVETGDVARLFKLYRVVNLVAEFSGLEWKLPALSEYIDKDQKTFQDKYVLLHEQTQDAMLRDLAPLFVEALRKGCDLVVEKERHYWEREDFLLFRFIYERGAQAWVEEVGSRLAHVGR